MSRVGSVGGTTARPGTRAARPAAGFALGGGPAAPTPANAAGVAAMGAMTLTALQEDLGAVATRRDAAARRRGQAMLVELDGLQRELLDGVADIGRLERLATLTQGDDGADPALRVILREVALRAAVELARRGR